MQTSEETRDRFNDLIFKSVNENIKKIVALPTSGSSRKYFRITTETKSLVGTYNSNIEENEAFFEFSRHFSGCGLPVPEVIAVSDGKDFYVQTDFGDDTLFNEVERCLENGHFDAGTIGLYKKVLEHLIDFQVIGHKDLDYSKAFPTPAFDRTSVMDDLNYFKYCFLKPNEEISFNETRLDSDFQSLADKILKAPSDFFMYRDFQSRNIMIKDDEPYFIDYQGGRKGPLQYDVISLLYQAKARIPENIREELLGHYLNTLEVKTSGQISRDAFMEYYDDFKLLRLLQVLGAYGFRGLIQRKVHFLQSIPFAIRELLNLTGKKSLTHELPELGFVTRQMESLLEKYEHGDSEVLTVRINSFSYKNGGIPTDSSGNGGGFVFDCRALPNPGRYAEYKNSTGEDADVKEFMDSHQDTHFFLQNTQMLVFQSIDNYLERGFKDLQINFGCTGGQHRSVYFAQKNAEIIRDNYPMVRVIVNHIVQHKKHIYEPR